MKIQVIVKDVGNADALFFVLQRDKDTLVGVIDGGRIQDCAETIPYLDKLLAKFGKLAPDLVVGTHYDNDHIAGLLPLLQHYHHPHTVLWMFDTSNVLSRIKQELEQIVVEGSMFPTEEQVSIGSEFGVAGIKAEEVFLTSLQKEQEVLEYARSIGMPIIEPIAGKCFFSNWPEIMVLGPTQTYYDQLFPERLNVKDLLEEMIRANAGKNEPDPFNPCARFNRESSPVSRINLLSAIIRIQVDDKKYLFTGDAGIDSFKAIPDHTLALSSIFWLKMPHHGSANNMNEYLLNLMKPERVSVSGASYADEELISCMRAKGFMVRVTKDEGDLIEGD